jgi:hypothetical protein
MMKQKGTQLDQLFREFQSSFNLAGPEEKNASRLSFILGSSNR